MAVGRGDSRKSNRQIFSTSSVNIRSLEKKSVGGLNMKVTILAIFFLCVQRTDFSLFHLTAPENPQHTKPRVNKVFAVDEEATGQTAASQGDALIAVEACSKRSTETV